jgi:hypothetical protein
MSHAMKFSGPFVKSIYTSLYDSGTDRQSNNPLYNTPFEVPVPSPFRRINTIIQNQGTTEVNVGLDLENTILYGQPSLKLYAGQSMSLDNYNGPIMITSAGAFVVTISESFA